MDQKVLIGALAVIVLLGAIYIFVLQPAQAPATEFEGERSLDDAYLEMGDSWRSEGIDLDTFDLSDEGSVKAVPDSSLESVKDKLALFKAGLNEEEYPDKAALEALADVFTAKADMVLAQKAYLLAEDRANLLASDSAEQVCGKLSRELVDSLGNYVDAFDAYLAQGNEFLIAFGGESLVVDFFVGEEEEALLESLIELYGGYSTALANC